MKINDNIQLKINELGRKTINLEKKLNWTKNVSNIAFEA